MKQVPSFEARSATTLQQLQQFWDYHPAAGRMTGKRKPLAPTSASLLLMLPRWEGIYNIRHLPRQKLSASEQLKMRTATKLTLGTLTREVACRRAEGLRECAATNHLLWYCSSRQAHAHAHARHRRGSSRRGLHSGRKPPETTGNHRRKSLSGEVPRSAKGPEGDKSAVPVRRFPAERGRPIRIGLQRGVEEGGQVERRSVHPRRVVPAVGPAPQELLRRPLRVVACTVACQAGRTDGARRERGRCEGNGRRHRFKKGGR